MKLRVDKDLCIGCGACQAICPDVFEIEDDGLAVSVVEEVSEEVMEDAIDAKEGCPVNAIEEVSEEVMEDAIDAKEGCPVNAIEEVSEYAKENNQEN